MPNKYTGTGNTLTRKQEKIIDTVLLHKTIEEGARAAGISKTSLYDYLHQPAFREAFESRRKEVVEYGLHELKMAVSEAAHVMRCLLESERESVRLKAATEILNHVGRFMEIEDIQLRLLKLEKKQIEENDDGRKTVVLEDL